MQADAKVSITARPRPIDRDCIATMGLPFIEASERIEAKPDVVMQDVADLAFFWRQFQSQREVPQSIFQMLFISSNLADCFFAVTALSDIYALSLHAALL